MQPRRALVAVACLWLPDRLRSIPKTAAVSSFCTLISYGSQPRPLTGLVHGRIGAMLVWLSIGPITPDPGQVLLLGPWCDCCENRSYLQFLILLANLSRYC